MARFLKTAQKLLINKPHKTSYYAQNPYTKPQFFCRDGLVGTRGAHAHASAEVAALKSPLESNILRIVRKEIVNQLQYAPPQQPVPKYDTFTVEDHPGEQWVTLKGKSSDNEYINIEATMFDGFVDAPQVGGEGWGVNPRLHLSLLIDVAKEEGHERLQFACSAWPDRLEIQNVFLLKHDGSTGPYMGPNIRKMKSQLQTAFYDYLKIRGVSNDLAVFLHQYMMNKDRIELIRWFKNVQTFVES